MIRSIKALFATKTPVTTDSRRFISDSVAENVSLWWANEGSEMARTTRDSDRARVALNNR